MNKVAGKSNLAPFSILAANLVHFLLDLFDLSSTLFSPFLIQKSGLVKTRHVQY